VPRTLLDRGFVDPAVVARLRAENSAGIADNSLRLYALLSLELWCQTFLDKTWSFDDVMGAGFEPRDGVAAA
jgi:hypothetical protein